MWIWFGLAVLALIGELATGTFTLLLIAVGLAAGGVAVIVGVDLPVQLIVCSISVVAGLLVLRASGVLKKRHVEVGRNVAVNLDIGQIVTVEDWADQREARVWYRGASWQVALASGCDPTPGEQVIVEIRGSQLIVAPRQLGSILR
jgi:membrane protein implicated in regulation of membrane protease activity